jgi:hypothetical protein
VSADRKVVRRFLPRPVKITLKHVLVMMMLLAPRALVWGASDDQITWLNKLEADFGNGLEVDNATSLQVLIEDSSEEEKKIGLTGERIEARVNQSLRKAGITPVNANPAGPNDEYLYANVTAIGSGSYSVSIFFKRRVLYRSRGKWFTEIGSTWNRGSAGYADDKDYILNRVAEHVEVFCNEFLKANGK